MHPSSFRHMKRVFERYLRGAPAGLVLEVGSASMSGGYRAIFEAENWEYVGAGIVPGPNVQFILEDAYSWNIPDATFDAVVSGQMLEHNEMFWLTFIEMARVLAPGGHMVHIAPSRGPQHRAPQDCWRFYRDGMLALAKWSGLECLEATTDWRADDLAWMKKNRAKDGDPPASPAFGDPLWGDTVGVFRKAPGARPDLALDYMHKLAAKWG